MAEAKRNHQEPSLIDALIPVLFLVGLLFASVQLYGDNSSSGPNQIALILAAGIAVLIGIKNGFSWKQIEAGIVQGISTALGAMLILLAVGSLIGTWILSGTVPTMIYYGLELINPQYFYPIACLVCAIVSVSIGSSWTTASTIGLALIGIAGPLGMSLEITAGAIISGAYFGDKMSPLSDTTNLAPAVAGSELFDHIRNMTWTTVPSIIIALSLFFFIGLSEDVSATENSLQDSLALLEQHFNITWLTLLPLALVLFLAHRRFPAFPTIIIGALAAGVLAMFVQGEGIINFVGENRVSCERDAGCSISNYEKQGADFLIEATTPGKDGKDIAVAYQYASADGELKLLTANAPDDLEVAVRSNFVTYIDGIWRVMYGSFSITTEDDTVNSLLNRGGMESMLNTIWLIICAMVFGAVLEKVGILKRLVVGVLSLAKSTGSLFLTTLLTCIGINIIAADQYIAIVLPGRMYKLEFERRGLAPKNLSRVLEDSATITSPLIPWNTCGAFMAGTLGVATFAYLPFCFFNILNPIISAIYGYAGFKVIALEDSQNEEDIAQNVDLAGNAKE
jgi:Na+:H+ antiporter, NhaC family